jgi:hypothetical protein
LYVRDNTGGLHAGLWGLVKRAAQCLCRSLWRSTGALGEESLGARYYELALGDNALGDNALGDNALGDNALGDNALGDVAYLFLWGSSVREVAPAD